MVTRTARANSSKRRSNGLRVGLFGLLGSGNLGNNASFEVVFTYLRTQHPDAVLDAMVMGPERLASDYGIPAIPLLWCQQFEGRTTGVKSFVVKCVGKVVDAFRTASWVRKHDVVIVPGTGILEATLPLRAWGVPYGVFLLCAFGKLFRTKVALVSVGANSINQRTMRWLFKTSAQLSSYRSFRDVPSRDALKERGLDTSCDDVFTDLVFGLPTPPDCSGDPQTVGVAVMAYYGASDDRRHAAEINRRYVDAVKEFVRWLVDNGHRVQFFWSDDADGVAVAEILHDLQVHRPGLDPASIVARPFISIREIMKEMALVGTVVATRYHIVLAALKLNKPTISIGYSEKHGALMADMGQPQFTQSVRTLDVGTLIRQFTELERSSWEIRRNLKVHNCAKQRAVQRQFGVLSSMVLSPEIGEAASSRMSPNRSDPGSDNIGMLVGHRSEHA
jgi:polysaccharide pyruvyl transferase WcaK-like protein